MPSRTLRPRLRVSVLAACFVLLLTVLAGWHLPNGAAADSASATWEVQSNCSETTNLLTRKNISWDGATDGTCTTNTPVTGQPAFHVSVDGYAYFAVDDTYMSGSTYPYARIDVEYFDGAYRSNGNTQFFLEYQSASGAAASQQVYLNNTQAYITATFYLSNVNFANTQGGGSDFRINLQDAGSNTLYFKKITVTRSQTSLAPSYASASGVTYQAPGGSENQSGLYLINAPGGHTGRDTQYGRTATKVSDTTNTDSAGYAFFSVDDSYSYQGNYPFASIQVSYFDKGTGNLRIQYDATGNAHQESAIILLGNSNQWVTQTVYLTGVNFGNRQAEAGNIGDFRLLYLADSSGYRLLFDNITVVRSSTDLTPNYGTVGSVSFTSPNHDDGLRVVTVADNLVTPLVITDSLGLARSATQVSASGYAFFNVNDSYIYNGNYGYATVEVTYFDQGYGFFYLTYDSNSSLAGDPAASQSFDLNLQSNNVAYLTDSRTWKTYTFYLSNVKFANRQLVSLADLQLVYPMTGNATTANQGYLLAVNKVTVTRYSAAPDRTASLTGNYPGFGSPVVVWPRLAQANEEGHGLWQNDSVSDGVTTAETKGGQQSRLNSPGGFIYFDVNDNYIKNGNAYHTWLSLEYFDSSFNPFFVEYDSTSGTKATESVTRTGSNTWKRYTFYITDPYFGGRVNGSDFRIAAPTKDLNIKGVYVERAPGDNVKPRAQTFSGSSFNYSDRTALVYYFPVFDGYYPSLWETSTMGPPGANGSHIVTSYSWRSVATIKKDLEDMKAAHIDGMLVWYPGNTTDSSFGSVQMMHNLVEAARQVSNPPKIGLLLDSVHFYTEKVMKEPNTLLDLTTNAGKGYFFKLAEDFYSQLPSDLWLRINGKPLINIYYQGVDVVSDYDASTIESMKQQFKTSFGLDPYVFADYLWDPQASKGIPTDEWCSWGAALAPSSFPGFANTSTMAVGPGFNDGVRVRDREGGDFYARGWSRAIGKGNHVVLIDTWNYWVEGTAIAESAEYGRAYINLTAQYIDQYKSAGYSNTNQVSVSLGSSNTSTGILQDEVNGGATTVASVGGLTGRRPSGTYVYFSVDDSFAFRRGVPFTLSIKYWDADAAHGGADNFVVEYDGVGGYQNYPPQSTANTVDIKNHGNTQQWKTATFTFNDGYFGNRMVNANDLRITVPGGGLVINQVTIQAAQALSLPNKIYLPVTTRVSTGW